MQPAGSEVDDSDIVVQTFDEAEGDFVVGLAVDGDAVLVLIDPLGGRCVA